ncbi:hypothetical protein ILYODFUR_027886 [Ilyodon furcidens]|uniref:Uncharacterized protein n=1 Tax=Ilyodon furcidens TaxID=33524 RepID=A0ABV0U904_9TELE
MYKTQHLSCRLVLQTFVKELVVFRRSVTSSVIPSMRCHLCNKSSHEISSHLNIPQSIVSFITKCKNLGIAETQTEVSANAKVNGVQRSPTSCRVNRYRALNIMWP